MTHSIEQIEKMMGDIKTEFKYPFGNQYLLTEKEIEFVNESPGIISSLLAKLKVADAALEFYADQSNFSGGDGETVMENFKQNEDWDGLEPIGTRARQAREEIK